ncbi:MAG TPA: hypothetical protein VHG89_11705 [Verrucomicrobiae bacterium]|nr:hypothetical protein [Verrucomicrobiae bacterium]
MTSNIFCRGALKAVHDFFEAHPKIEVVLAGSIITDGSGKYICHRHSLVPDVRHAWFRFPVLTAALFIRRKVTTSAEFFLTRAGAIWVIFIGCWR